MLRIERRLKVAASAMAFYRVVTDYPRYPSYVPQVRRVEILALDGDRALARFHARVVRPFSYVLRLVGEPCRRLAWEQTEGPFISNIGSWSLVVGGDRSSEWVYRDELEPGFLVPDFAARLLLGAGLNGMLRRMAAAAANADRGPAGATP
jgi:coenzyme Q-binding protein COQ10